MSKANNLLTKTLAAKLPAVGHYEMAEAKDIPVRLKIFDPCGGWTWYATEYNPETKTFYGFVVGFEEELGYFSLEELETVRNRMGLPLERDLYWRDATLAEVMEGKRR